MPELPVPASVPSLVEEHLATAPGVERPQRRHRTGGSSAGCGKRWWRLSAGRRLHDHENPR